jgi:serine/threonine-protein kinase HipA
MISGETDLSEPFEHWIIKFAAENDFPDAGPVEYAYSLMAREAGIKMTETRLFNTPEGDYFFGIKRFDRRVNHRFHVHTFGNLIHSNFRIPSQDYDHFFKLVINLTKNHQDLIRAFRQMVFNIFANNRDDHVKNFAFIMNHKGEWSLSPAYDLIYSPGPGGEHSMTVLGEGKAPTKADIYKVGEKHGIKKKTIGLIVDKVSDAANNFQTYAKAAGVSKATLKKINAKIKNNLNGFSRT